MKMHEDRTRTDGRTSDTHPRPIGGRRVSHGWAWAARIPAALCAVGLLIGCGDRARSGLAGERVESLDGTVITFRGSGEAEVFDSDMRLAATYSVEADGRIRVSVEAFGAEQIFYFERSANGLKDLDGGEMLYFPSALDSVRDAR